MHASDLRHAYATLGLTPPVTEETLKRRYKELVKRWHPDRFQSDPEGQAEAEIKLRNVNIAYETIAQSLESDVQNRDTPESEPPDYAPGATPWNNRPSPAASGRHATEHMHLSPEQIDSMVASINGLNRPRLPGRSLERRLTIAVWLGSLILARMVSPATKRRSADIFILALCLLVPVAIIWINSNEDDGGVGHWLARIFAWLLLLAPPILTMFYWSMNWVP